MQVVKAVAKCESGWPFAVPVTDDVAPGYSKEIDKPMDLGSVAKSIKSGSYTTLGVFCPCDRPGRNIGSAGSLCC